MQENYITNGAEALAQPSSTLSSRYLKERLCCPIVWTWVSFSLHLIGALIYIAALQQKFKNYSSIYNEGFNMLETLIIIILVAICVANFVVALLVTLSARSCDIAKYSIAIGLYIGYFASFCIYWIYYIIILSKTNYIVYTQDGQTINLLKITIIIACVIIGFESITLIIHNYFQ